MDRRRCAACRKVFTVRAQTPQQRYCSAPGCQRERRRRWQREKRRSDPDYRENQRQAQQRWASSHREYWRRYRAEHPEYTAANRIGQRERDRRRREHEALPSARVDLAKRGPIKIWIPALHTQRGAGPVGGQGARAPESAR